MTLATRDPLNAFLAYPDVPVPHAETGPLAGHGLAVKDIFDVAGYRTGGGNPDKLAESPIARRTAPAVAALLDAGARFVGKTQTEELTYSMIGLNAHFPAPVNPRAVERVTGGSSSGSAAAVAGGLTDIAVGSDTNGSIRAPASFCGLIGLRTTHGRISLEGAMPLSPAFDTFGWFARDGALYEAVGAVLLGDDTHAAALTRPVRVAAFEALLFGEDERTAYAAMAARVADSFAAAPATVALPDETEALFDAFKVMQAYEAWQVHGPFLEAADRRLGPGIRQRFDYARSVTRADFEAAADRRRRFQTAFAGRMAPDTVIVMPSQPSAAPLKSSTQDELERYRNRALTLTAIAGLLGWPQITVPLGTVHGAPFGISLLGPAGSDRQLIRLARRVMGEG
ncbi:amidase [Aquibium sp. A9E412]|uniref:amidase n=1 Tax=Aquibium sp. A9E412 TaxID=2976767 RepID=UPI0025AF50D4|nr:amidase [Aquibium sp. A9E412]MDN2567269.1 amidase [Aquibium sp. A9E412]